MTGENKGQMHIVDKQSPDLVKVLTPEPCRTAFHAEVSKDGGRALEPIRDLEGAVIFHHAAAFTELKRLPIMKPSEKWNVWNTRSPSNMPPATGPSWRLGLMLWPFVTALWWSLPLGLLVTWAAGRWVGGLIAQDSTG